MINAAWFGMSGVVLLLVTGCTAPQPPAFVLKNDRQGAVFDVSITLNNTYYFREELGPGETYSITDFEGVLTNVSLSTLWSGGTMTVSESGGAPRPYVLRLVGEGEAMKFREE